jgi:hypothetical protein
LACLRILSSKIKAITEETKSIKVIEPEQGVESLSARESLQSKLNELEAPQAVMITIFSFYI